MSELQSPKPDRRPTLPETPGPRASYGRRARYGQQQQRAAGSVVVMVTLRPDSAAAVLELVKAHNLSRAGAAHHLIRLGAGLPPLPPLS